MKKLFFSLVLGTLIAICWVMVVHTLKWIAIRGNEFELITLSQQQQHQQQQQQSALNTGNFISLDSLPSQAQTQTQSQPQVMMSEKSQTYAQANIHQPVADSNAATFTSTFTRRLSQDADVDDEVDKETTRLLVKEVTTPASIFLEQRAGSPNLVPVKSASIIKQLQSYGSQLVTLRPTTSSKIITSSTHHSVVILKELGPNYRDEDSLKSSHSPDGIVNLMSGSGSGSRIGSQLAGDDNSNEETETILLDQQATQAAASTILTAWPSPADRAATATAHTHHLTSDQSQIEGKGGSNSLALLYKAPFFTSWFVSTWNILFMPIFTLISSCCFRNEDSSTKKLLVESISQFMDNGLTTLEFLGRCAFFSILWIGTIFGIVYSLSNIDATVVMALFACSAALVYLLSWVLLHQQFVGVRIVAVIICTTGIALLAYMDNSRTLGSVLIVAGSALCSAVYKVIYQRMFGFWSIAQMSLFFTLIGLFNAFLMWPVALLLYFLGVELIVWHYIPWMHLTAAGALYLTANIVAYFGPICSYDIFLTLGLLLAVILSAVIDVTFYKITFLGMKLAGVLLLMIGFLVCLLPENWNEFLYDLVNERFVRWKKQRNLKKSRNKVQDLSTGQVSRLRTPSGRVK